jgi:cell wall-associated NlpC family hydrolase
MRQMVTDMANIADARRSRTRAVTIIICAMVGCLLAAVGGYILLRSRGPATASAEPPAAIKSAAPTPSDGVFTFQRLTGPDRSVVRDSRGAMIASFTDGARTVLLTGPERTFSEPANTSTVITTTAWIRLAPEEWHAGSQDAAWFRPWLTAALADTTPDVLAVATEYLHGTAEKRDGKGIRYAGDASFGPASESDPDGRAENSDFYDYLGIPWQFPDTGLTRPKPARYGDVDCSGYLRLVYGYRLGYPLRNANTAGVGLPRRAFAISQFGPGVEVIPNRGVPPSDYHLLQPGDLVFFNSDPGTGPFRTDHSGIFMGVDSAGHYRFISSRSKADGPTFGDTGGAALLDGGGHWSQRFRNARRI